jgi:hypothetical protein
LAQLEGCPLSSAGLLDIDIRAFGDRQPVLALQVLGRDLRGERFVHPVPEGRVQRDPAGDDVDMLVRGVAMDDDGEHVAGRVEPDLLHEAGGHLVPLVAVQVLASREAQGAMPDGPCAVRPELPGGGELGSEGARGPAVQIPPDDFARVAPVECVFE